MLTPKHYDDMSFPELQELVNNWSNITLKVHSWILDQDSSLTKKKVSNLFVKHNVFQHSFTITKTSEIQIYNIYNIYYNM